jgi:hypothetical protein
LGNENHSASATAPDRECTLAHRETKRGTAAKCPDNQAPNRILSRKPLHIDLTVLRQLPHYPVNKEIEASIRNTPGNEFALFNNGITIVAEGTSISTNTAKQGTAQIILRNPQLVNGAQTAYTLARIYEDCVSSKDFKVFRGKEVLMRVINFLGPAKLENQDERIKLMGEISRASNSQTKVEESDRRSNDPVQIRIQNEFFEKYGLYYERKRGEFSDGLHYGYLLPDQLVNRERLVRISLACNYDVSQTRSGISKFFDEVQLASLLKTKEIAKYAYGYEVLQGLDRKRKSKLKTKGDRYLTSQFGQALRYGQYAVVAVCANLGQPKGKTASQALEAALKQWKIFESWVEAQPSNRAYKPRTSFDYVSYYKGSTIKGDLQTYSFTF